MSLSELKKNVEVLRTVTTARRELLGPLMNRHELDMACCSMIFYWERYWKDACHGRKEEGVRRKCY